MVLVELGAAACASAHNTQKSTFHTTDRVPYFRRLQPCILCHPRCLVQRSATFQPALTDPSPAGAHLRNSSSCRALRSRASLRSQGSRKRTQGLEFCDRPCHTYYLKQITVGTCATKASDPLTALTPLVEPALADTRPPPLSPSFNIQYYY